MSNFNTKENTITNCKEIIYGSTKIFTDNRGSFRETFTKKALEELGITDTFVQTNLSISKSNVIRGLHFQAPPKAQSKLVEVVQGLIYDYALDIRKSSENYGKLYVYHLQAGDFVYIPAGFAHGFYSLQDDTIVEYMCNEYYSQEHEGGINPFDPVVGFVSEQEVKDVIVHGKDLKWPTWTEFVSPFD